MFVRKEIVHSFDIVLCIFVCDYSKQAVFYTRSIVVHKLEYLLADLSTYPGPCKVNNGVYENASNLVSCDWMQNIIGYWIGRIELLYRHFWPSWGWCAGAC